MAIKCYFMTPKIYKIPNLKNTKTGRGLRKKVCKNITSILIIQILPNIATASFRNSLYILPYTRITDAC